MGKLILSVLSLVKSITTSYKNLKRQAIQMGDMPFIFLSLTSQVLARIVALVLYFSSMREFEPWLPILLVVHFAILFGIKWTFAREWHTEGKFAKTVAILNVVASSIVYVGIKPMEKEGKGSNQEDKEMDRAKEAKSNEFNARELDLHYSTFFVQFLVFLISLVENVLLSVFPLIRGVHEDNRALDCFSVGGVQLGVLLVVLLSITSCIFQAAYYKVHHIWSGINGPQFKDDVIHGNYYIRGQKKKFKAPLSCFSPLRKCRQARKTALNRKREEG